MRKFWIGMSSILLLVVASWIGNLWYYQAHQLGKTVFLEHHLEVRMVPGEIFDLYYLEDLHAEKKVSGIIIQDHPDMRVQAHTPDYRRYSHQVLGRFMLSVSPDYMVSEKEDSADEPSVIQSVIVQYHDGTTKEMDIGEIRLIKESTNEGDSPLNWSSGGSSSDLTGFSTLQIERPIELIDIKSHYLNLIGNGQLQFYINIITNPPGSSFQMRTSEENLIALEGVPFHELILPQKMQKRDSIRFSYKYVPGEAMQMDIYQLRIQLEMTEAEHIWKEALLIYATPSFSEAAVRDFVKEKRRQP